MKQKGFWFGSAQNGKPFDADAQQFYGQVWFLTYSLIVLEIDKGTSTFQKSMRVYLLVFLACLPACLDGRREDSTGEKKLVRRKIPVQVYFSSLSVIFTSLIHMLYIS
jgi:hypothetical protein